MRGTTALRTMITKICRNVFQNLFLSESSRNEIKIFFNKISHHMMSKSREGPNKTKFPQSKHQHSWQLCEQGTMQNKSLFSKRAAAFFPLPPLHVCSVFTLRTRKDHGEWISEKKSIVIPNAYIGGGVVCTKKYLCSV